MEGTKKDECIRSSTIEGTKKTLCIRSSTIDDLILLLLFWQLTPKFCEEKKSEFDRAPMFKFFAPVLV
jgi:hypothetical protein